MQAMADIAEMVERETTWFLTRLGRPLDMEQDTAYFRDGIDRLRADIENVVTPGQAEEIESRVAAGMKEGLPKALAREIALIPTLASACDIIRIALERDADLMLTARTYFELGEYFQLDWLRGQAMALAVGDRWSQEALDGLIEQLHTSQAGLTVRILRDMEKMLKGKGATVPAKGKKGGKAKASQAVSVVREWIETYEAQATHLEPFFAEIRRTGAVDLPLLIIAEQRLRHLYGG
jgi:NAD-specific glutamate dehydrogenase